MYAQPIILSRSSCVLVRDWYSFLRYVIIPQRTGGWPT